MWIVMTSSAAQKRGYGQYRNVALVQLHPHATAWGEMPARIDQRIKGILRIRHLGRHNLGSTERCAYARVKAQAEAMAYELNNTMPEAAGELLASWGGSA